MQFVKETQKLVSAQCMTLRGRLHYITLHTMTIQRLQ